jgi:hypothetical protein
MAIINGCCGFGNSYTFIKNENQYNFDVDADWDLNGTNNQQKFQDLLGVTVTAFKYSGKNIKAFITSVTSDELYFQNLEIISKINYITVEGLLSINLNNNNITEFNPSKNLPNSLLNLDLGKNELRFFKPDFKLPISLTNLNLSSNKFVLAGYTDSEVWANNIYVAPTAGGYIDFTDNTDSVSTTNLETILVSKGWNVSA